MTAALKLSTGISPECADFMAEFNAGTTAHPFAPFMRVWQNAVSFEVKVFSGAIRLGCIQTLAAGKGNASKALDWLVALARKHGVDVRGDVKPLGTAGLGSRALRDWYKRHGFSVKQDGSFSLLATGRGGAGRGQGRKPLVAGEETTLVTGRVTDAQRHKYLALGGSAWLREQIDRAVLPQ